MSKFFESTVKGGLIINIAEIAIVNKLESYNCRCVRRETEDYETENSKYFSIEMKSGKTIYFPACDCLFDCIGEYPGDMDNNIYGMTAEDISIQVDIEYSQLKCWLKDYGCSY